MNAADAVEPKMCQRAETVLPCEPVSVARARHWALDQLARMYEGQAGIAADVELVVSELVTNCVRADAHRFAVAIEGHHTSVRVAARDDAPGVPVKCAPPRDRSGGRGLIIVDALARRWGVTSDGEGKTVWAEFPLPDDVRATFDCSAR